jgi:Mce-associated membrane protein
MSGVATVPTEHPDSAIGETSDRAARHRLSPDSARRWYFEAADRVGTELARRPGRVARMLAGALVAAVLLGGGAFAAWQYYTAAATAGQDAMSAAHDAIPQVLSYDPPSVDDQVASTQELMVGQFKNDYAQLVRTVVDPATKAKRVAVQTGVTKESVISASPDQVELLLFINRTVERADSSDPVLTSGQIRVTMRRQNSQWLISQITPV